MPPSFWVNLLVCIGSILYACFEHTEIRGEFKTAAGRERIKSGVKLFLLWAVPVGTFIATIWTAWEGVQSDAKSEVQINEIARQSNAVLRVEIDFRQQSNELFTAKSNLNQAKQELRKVGPRRLNEDEKRIMVALLENVPKVQFNFGLNSQIEDSDGFFQDLTEVLTRAGFKFCKARWYTFSGNRLSGVWVSASSNPNVTEGILKAFNAVGLSANSGKRPNPGTVLASTAGGYDGTTPCDEGETISIEIGYK